MARPFGDADIRGSHRAKAFQRGVHQHGMRVDGGAGIEFHQVRLDHHALAAHVDAMLDEQPPDRVIDGLRVSGAHDRHARLSAGARPPASSASVPGCRPKPPRASRRVILLVHLYSRKTFLPRRAACARIQSEESTTCLQGSKRAPGLAATIPWACNPNCNQLSPSADWQRRACSCAAASAFLELRGDSTYATPAKPGRWFPDTNPPPLPAHCSGRNSIRHPCICGPPETDCPTSIRCWMPPASLVAPRFFERQNADGRGRDPGRGAGKKGPALVFADYACAFPSNSFRSSVGQRSVSCPVCPISQSMALA